MWRDAVCSGVKGYESVESLWRGARIEVLFESNEFWRQPALSLRNEGAPGSRLLKLMPKYGSESTKSPNSSACWWPGGVVELMGVWKLLIGGERAPKSPCDSSGDRSGSAAVVEGARCSDDDR